MDTTAISGGVAHDLSSSVVRDLARECGFALAGVSGPESVSDFTRFDAWRTRGMAAGMGYLTDHRGDLRQHPSNLLAGLRSIVCVGMVYNGPEPYSTEFGEADLAWISRYAWGDDYHILLRERLEQFAQKLLAYKDFQWRACVDTAPLLERSLAHRAGLGWIGKNTCLIHEKVGSWFFLGELLTTLQLAPDSPLPDRCGSCSRCVEACPTRAIVPSPQGGFELDSRLCISYFTIEHRGAVPEAIRPALGRHVFGCDICQDVCPWNSPRRALQTMEPAFAPKEFAPKLERMAALTGEEFRAIFRSSPVSRAKYSGFLRNVAIAMGNAARPEFEAPLRKLADSEDAVVAEHAAWALARIAASR